MDRGKEQPLAETTLKLHVAADPGEADGAASDLSDTADLVRRAQSGKGRRDPDAFSELIRRYERSLLSIGYAALGDSDRAADVAQEAFVKAWEKLDTLQDPTRFGPWLCGIARNLATDIRRRLRLAPRSGTDILGDSENTELSAPDHLAPDPTEELDRRERIDLVTEALDNLDEATRTVLVLRYYDDRSSKEIGELLGLSPAAVDMRLSRARAEMKKRLGATQAFSA